MAYLGPGTPKWRLIVTSDSLLEIEDVLELLIAAGKYDPGALLSHVIGLEEELQIGWETTVVVRTAETAVRLVEQENQ